MSSLQKATLIREKTIIGLGMQIWGPKPNLGFKKFPFWGLTNNKVLFKWEIECCVIPQEQRNQFLI